jgi:Tol biopolymer transport system component
MVSLLRRATLVGFMVVVLHPATPGWTGPRGAPRDACPSRGQVAARSQGPYGQRIDLVDAGGCSTRTLVEGRFGAWTTDPVWSPDGNTIAYGWWKAVIGPVVEATEIRVSRVRAGGATTVLRLPVVGLITEIDWSPDGRRFAFSLFTWNWPAAFATWSVLGSTQRIYVVNADGSGLRTISTVNASFDEQPRWAPDSRRLAYVSWLPVPVVVVVDADAIVPVPAQINPIGTAATAPRWSPTGGRIAFAAWPTASEPGSLLGPPDLWVAGADGRGAQKILEEVWSASWAPDERLLAADGAEGLRIVRPGGGAARRLTFEGALSPAWSPGGELIAFLRWSNTEQDASAQSAIWTVRPDGKDAHRISEPTEYGYSVPVWRP